MADAEERGEALRVTLDTSRLQKARFGWAAVIALVVSMVLTAFGAWSMLGYLGALFFLVLRSGAQPRFREYATARIDKGAERVVLDGIDGGRKESIAFSKIRAAHIDDTDGVLLELRDRRTLRAREPDVLRAAELVESLGLKATRVRRVPLLSIADTSWSILRIGGALGLVFTVVLACAGMVSLMDVFAKALRHTFLPDVAAIAAVVTFIGVTGALSLAAFFRRGEAVIGADGVRIRSFLRERFIPYSRIRKVATSSGGIRLWLEGHKSAELPLSFVGHMRGNRPGATEVVKAVERQIQRAIDASGRSDLSNARVAELDRNERSVAEWKEAVKMLVESDGGYRGAPIEPEELVGIAEDAAAPPDRRVGAALALGACGDETQKRRVRVAAASSADTDMKAALESAADGEVAEEQLDRAARKRLLA